MNQYFFKKQGLSDGNPLLVIYFFLVFSESLAPSQPLNTHNATTISIIQFLVSIISRRICPKPNARMSATMPRHRQVTSNDIKKFFILYTPFWLLFFDKKPMQRTVAYYNPIINNSINGYICQDISMKKVETAVSV